MNTKDTPRRGTKDRAIHDLREQFQLAARQRDIAEANCRELVAALQEMLKYAEGFEDADHVIDAREAIARATGEA